MAAWCVYGLMDFMGHGHILSGLFFGHALFPRGIALFAGFFQVLGVPDLPGNALGRSLASSLRVRRRRQCRSGR